MRKKRKLEYHSLVAPIRVSDPRGADSDIVALFQEAPKFDQRLTVEDNVRICHTHVFAGCRSHAPVDSTPVTDISSGLKIDNLRVRLQKFLRSIPGIIVHDGEGERKRRIEAVEEIGQLAYALQRVVINRDKRNINWQD